MGAVLMALLLGIRLLEEQEVHLVAQTDTVGRRDGMGLTQW